MTRRKPRFMWWIKKTPHGYEQPGGYPVSPENIRKWMSQEKRRMARLERREGRREIEEQLK